MTHVIRGLGGGNASAGNHAEIGNDGTFRLYGSATAYEDLRIDAMTTRIGVVAPTDETGFRGDANHSVRNMVNNQADEVQFTVQPPHSWKEGSTPYPHVHFVPWGTAVRSTAARFQYEVDAFGSSAEYGK